MVASFLRMNLAFLLGATLLWISLVLYLRSHRRELLEEKALAFPLAERDGYIRDGMQRYDRSLRRWTLILAWLAALGTGAGLIWYVNFN